VTDTEVEVIHITPEQRIAKDMTKKNPFDRYPFLECKEGALFDTLAICKFLAKGDDVLLGAKNRLRHAQITQDIKMMETQV